jgi:uncharacterized protein (DUF1015 family)
LDVDLLIAIVVTTIATQEVPSDVVGRLDCSILERELYPLLGLDHSLIANGDHFDYYPESQLDMMKEVVDAGKYDIAVRIFPPFSFASVVGLD